MTQDTGPLDWRIAITDKAGRPTPEFQRRWAIQRGNNALIGAITLGSGAPNSTPLPKDGSGYIDTSVIPFVFYIAQGGTWHQVGVKTFIQLSDVPSTYTSANGKLVRVNSGATALEFDTLTSILDTLGSSQGDVLYRGSTGWTVLAPGTSGDFLTTHGAGANPTWTAGGGGGGQHEYEPFGSLPAPSAFTWLNQQTWTVSADAISIVFDSISTGSQPISMYQLAAPGSTPWTAYARIHSFVNNGRVGLAVRGAGAGNTTVITYNQNTLYCIHDTVNTGSGSGVAVVNNRTLVGPIPQWFSINNDGTNLTFSYSFNGLTYIPFYTETIASWCGTADDIGIDLAPESSGGEHASTWVSNFGTTTPV